MSMELKILTAEDKFLKAIEFNFDELKDALGTELKKYEGLTYTAASFKDAKADRATLNKFKDAIDDKRKELKNRCLAPYKEFEAKIKVLTGMVDEQASAIDKQIKVFEDNAKECKRNELKTRWETIAGNIASNIPFERVMDSRWLNASYNINTANADMDKKYDDIMQSIKCINAQAGEYITPVTQKYFETLCLASALAYKDMLANMDKAKNNTNTTTEVKTNDTPSTVETCPDEARAYDFRVWLNQSQKEALVSFLKQNNIKYGKVG